MSDEPTSILAFRNGSIGNTLAAVPALRALRRSFPRARLTVIVDRTGFELLEHCPWLDGLIVYDKRGHDRGAAGYLRVLRQMRAVHPTHAVLFKRFFRNGLLAFLSGARVRAGFRTDGRAPFLNVTIPYREGVSVVDLNLELAALLGAKSGRRELEIFLTAHDENAARELAAVHGGPPYCVVHFGGRTTPPDFVPPPRFVALVRALMPADRPVFATGAGEHERRHAELLARMDSHFIPAAGLPVRHAAALIKQAALFVGFNSGPAHIAAATGVRGIMLFRPGDGVHSEIRKWSPPGDTIQPLVPPVSDDDTEWERFIQEAARAVAH